VLPITNLTGHPAVVVQNDFQADGTPASISFIGQLYGESRLCTVARAWQDATGWHRRHPAGFTDR
jgi:Asp-tRNA(Asn)/Glu-tRNA(Gln) amidotransferase A subunit family amidase